MKRRQPVASSTGNKTIIPRTKATAKNRRRRNLKYNFQQRNLHCKLLFGCCVVYVMHGT